MSIEDKIKEFKKLSFDKQKEKVINMLEILKWTGSLFNDIHEIITKIDVSENLLISIYSSIQSAIENINNKKLKDNIDAMEKVRTKLQNIKKMEEEEKNNNNPEKLLENL